MRLDREVEILRLTSLEGLFVHWGTNIALGTDETCKNHIGLQVFGHFLCLIKNIEHLISDELRQKVYICIVLANISSRGLSSRNVLA